MRAPFQIRAALRRRSGTAVVEFVLGSGVLLSAFTGVFEIGYGLIQYNVLENAVAQGAHYASMVPYDSATTSPSAAFQTAAKNMVLSGSPAGGTPVLNGLTASNVKLVVSFDNGVPSSMTVSITGLTINALFGTFTLTEKPRVTYPYTGVWAPA